jgi:cell division protein FtsQ
MSKTAVIRCLLSVVLICYLIVALFVSHDMAAHEMCRGIDIVVNHDGNSRNFVNADEVRQLLHEKGMDHVDRPLSSINMQAIEDALNSIDNIEHAVVERTATGKVKVNVTPMHPVARVFDGNRSYYINSAGKRLTANHRFRLDVPIISGHFTKEFRPQSLIPLIERISNDPQWNAIVMQIAIEPRHHDIILVPMIRGHVINIGDTTDIDNKLSRVMLMYRKVLPLKGWDYYDTLSVKWGGQVVATRRTKSMPEPPVRFDREGDEIDVEDVNSMLIATDTDTASVKR